MKQSPIFTRTYDLLLWLIPQTTSNSRYGVRSSDFSRCLRNRSD